MNIGILLVNVFTLVVICLILVYLHFDRMRFRVERQFAAVRSLFDEWAALCGQLPGCEKLAADYAHTRNISKKYRLLDALSSACWGKQTPEMTELTRELEPFCGVYRALAEPYNRKLDLPFWGGITAFLGFVKFPILQLER